MAHQLLLKGAYNGKLGITYGAKWKNQRNVKAIGFSHTPHNAIQNASFYSFAGLSRFASGISKYFGKYLVNSSKTMSQYNQVQKLFKPMISNHTFSCSKLPETLTSLSEVSVSDLSYNEETEEYQFNFENSLVAEPNENVNICYFVFFENGTVVGGKIDNTPNGALSFYSIPASKLPAYCFAIIAKEKNGRKKIFCSNIIDTGGTIYNNGIFYLNNVQSGDWIYVRPATAKSNNTPAVVRNNILVFFP